MPAHEKYHNEKPVRVSLSCCGGMIGETEVEFQNIEEDFYGRDVLTFICPKCGEIHKSFRFG